MPTVDAILALMKKTPAAVRFSELSKVCAHFFGPPRQAGTSHQVYRTPWAGDPRVNIQNAGGKAKAYQVRQVLKAIAKIQQPDAP
ncbi:MAG: toxin HicA [Lentisphaeria bacterium]